MTPTTLTDAILQTGRAIPFPASDIYQAFANPQQLATWWGPDGFTNSFEQFEFKEGGQWRFHMHGPDGHNYPNDAQFVELIPAEKLVIRHTSAPLFTLTISLTNHTDGTWVNWVQAFDDPNVAQAVRHIAEPGNEQNLDRLVQLLNEQP